MKNIQLEYISGDQVHYSKGCPGSRFKKSIQSNRHHLKDDVTCYCACANAFFGADVVFIF